jgi:hypothetical protein
VAISKKIIASFFISALLFSGVAFLVYSGFLDIVESRFYHPSVAETLFRETSGDAKILSDHLTGLQNRFSYLLHNPAVRRTFLHEQNADDIYERSMLFGLLLESATGLRSVRFVDFDGKQIHFSTYLADIIESNFGSIRYRNYDADLDSLPFDKVLVLGQEQGKMVFDGAGGRIIFSFPFYDSFDIYRGVALFDVSTRTLTDALATAGKISAIDNLVLCVNPEGIVSGIPGISSDEILKGISSIWKNGYQNIVPFISADVTLLLISVQMDQGIYYGRIVNEAVFVFPLEVKILTLIAIFLTIFLIIFFLFNLKKDPAAVFEDLTSNAGLEGKKAGPHGNETLEELEAVNNPSDRGKGLLAAAAHLASSSVDAIYEQDGIPYINDDVFNIDKTTEEQLNNNFVKLIDSVVNKT